MSGSHHPTHPPSAAARWLTCTASPEYIRDLPDPATFYAAEGTVFHSILADILRDETPYEIGRVVTEDGFDITVDQEMYTSAEWCTDRLLDIPMTVSLTEVPATVCVSGTDDELTSGTSDLVAVDDKSVLHVFDWKYGKGVKVFAMGNVQMLTYAAGVLDSLGFMLPEITGVRLHVMQPRLDHHDVWDCTVEQVHEHRERITDAVADSNTGMGVFAPSQTACQWCPAKGFCDARIEHLAKELDAAFDDLGEEGDITNAADEPQVVSALLRVYQLRAQFEDLVKAASEKAVSMARTGTHFAGMKLVRGRAGDTKWIDPAEAEAELRKMRMKLDEFMPRKLMSPTQAKKAQPKRYAKRLAPLTSRAPGALTLVPEDDRRDAVLVSDVDAEFDDLGEETDT